MLNLLNQKFARRLERNSLAGCSCLTTRLGLPYQKGFPYRCHWQLKLMQLTLTILFTLAITSGSPFVPLAEAQSKQGEVIFIIDESGSMGDEIDAVRNNVNFIAQQLQAEGVDFQLGLVGFGRSGSTRGAPDVRQVLTKDLNVFSTALATLVDTGGTEPGFEAVKLATSDAMGSFRNVPVCTVLISDEDATSNITEAAPATKDDATQALAARNGVFLGVIRSSYRTSSSDYGMDDGLAARTSGGVIEIADFATNPQPALQSVLNLCSKFIEVARENCFDGIDNDNDGAIDLNDSECAGLVTPTPEATPEPTPQPTQTPEPLVSSVRCTEQQLAESILALDSSSLNQRKLVGRIAARLPNAGGSKRKAQALKADASAIYGSAWTSIWSVPTTVRSCELNAACSPASHAAALESYLSSSKALHSKFISALNSLKRTKGELARRDRSLLRRAKRVMLANEKLLGQLPKESTVCDASVTVVVS